MSSLDDFKLHYEPINGDRQIRLKRFGIHGRKIKPVVTRKPWLTWLGKNAPGK